MLFSSLLFLYGFLPLVLFGYYLLPGKLKNVWLLLLSLVFFAFGGVSNSIILVISIILNYYFGRLIHSTNPIQSKRWLKIGIILNVLILATFKYANFFVDNTNYLLSNLNLRPLLEPDIALPIGISFYTFHLVSYLVDIYRGKTESQKNILDLALYVCMFSQLIAGPIIRYSDVWLQLKARVHTLQKFSSGIEKFLIGLGKKVLLANIFAVVADTIFMSNPLDLNAMTAWLGLICYTLQIYCDFSGYSDMAIGLGRMFGFEFMENFNFPYMASSIKEFWRRWHISLSTFFRDYVYIPIGGNQVKISRLYLNLVIVFLLTGFWHGANWTFILWGIMHGLFMILERLGLEKILKKVGQPFSSIYTLFVVMMAWVLFRSNSIEFAFNYWQSLFNFQNDSKQMSQFMGFLDRELSIAFVIALLGSFGFFSLIKNKLTLILHSKNIISKSLKLGFEFLALCFYVTVLILSSMYLVAGTYNPFIYYQF